jgi:Domain of unknown function (DUF4136)
MMKILSITLFSLALMAQGATVGKVESKVDKTANFGALHSYSWLTGYNADNPDVHKLIVAAVEAEMTKAGFTKVATGGDATIAYYTVRTTEVDLKALDKAQKAGNSATPTKVLGRLVVVMRPAASTQQIWSASTREFIDPDPAKLNDTVHSATARLFETYPGKKPARP